MMKPNPLTLIAVFAPLLLSLVPAPSIHARSAESQPVWDLSRDGIKPGMAEGTVAVEDGVVNLDGSNAFSLPASILGGQSDYTIEFEVKRPAETVSGPYFQFVSNADEEKKTGLSVQYFPPDYNSLWVLINGFRVVEEKGLAGGGFQKITLVVKDRNLSLFQDGLLTAITSAVLPSSQPLKFGLVGKSIPQPYELRNMKVYDSAVFPSGFDKRVGMMRNYSGDGFFMSRVDITDPSLPRILVVGDSISMGYRGFITEHFKDKAYVDYWVGGHWFGETARGPDSPVKRAWTGVLANGPYDVVSWNAMTLHMWNGDAGRCDEATYPANMTEVVEHLQETAPDTEFIWIRCTPWRTTPKVGPVGLDPVRNDVVVRLNGVTDEIMKAHGIPIVDLYTLAEGRIKDTIQDGCQDAVHWNEEVSAQMADAIIVEIEKALAAKSASD